MNAQAKLPSLHRTVVCQDNLRLNAHSVSFKDGSDMQVCLGMKNGLTSATTYISTAKARELAAVLIECADYFEAASADMQAKAA